MIAQDDLRRLMSVRPALGAKIFNALLARREYLRTGQGAQAIRIIGSRYSPEAMSLRSFAEHSRLAHAWTDVEDAEDLDALLAPMGLRSSDIPAVITSTEILRRPSAPVFAEHLGLTFQPTPGYIFDLVGIGSGPAVSRPPSTAPQRVCAPSAWTRSRSAGRPARAPGSRTMQGSRTASPAKTSPGGRPCKRCGSGRPNAPCEAVGTEESRGGFHIVLQDGSEIPTRAVIVASGARYQRLGVENLERFEGAGVYYAATNLEARVCRGKPALVIGGGNSAGQAATTSPQNDCPVTIAIRREDLTQSDVAISDRAHRSRPEISSSSPVSKYRPSPAKIISKKGDARPIRRPATSRRFACTGLFCFIGVRPATEWLGD